MQHRNSPRSSNGIDRRKSTSSAKSVHLEHILPELAERDAQAAAMQAFARAQDRGTTDTYMWPPPRYNSGIGESCSHKTPLRRQQSVRFIQPKPTQVSRANTASRDVIPANNTNSHRPRVKEVAGPPLDRTTFASGMASAAKGTAGDYINALITAEEYYTPEDDIASAPSSYRRIHKSRSMITRSESSAIGGFPGESRIPAMTSDWPRSAGSMASESHENNPLVRPEAPRSMSFLKSCRDDNAASSVAQEPTSLRLKTTGDTIFKRSLRDVSNESESISLRVPKDKGLRRKARKARKASHNLRHRFKNLFNLSREEKEELASPPQQIIAQTAYDTKTEGLDNHIDDAFQLDSPTDAGAMSRVTSGVPSLHAVPSNQQLRSRQGSVESLKVERKASDERSRVTSWSNSDTTTATTVNSLKRDWERQRLSIIKENGTHISSSSARRSPAIDYHMQPDTNVHPPQPSTSQPPPTVDGQRIYSALMKRANGKHTNPQKNEIQRNNGVEDFRRTGTVPLRGGSYNRDGYQLETPTTIRHVVTSDDSDLGSVRTADTIITPSRLQTDKGDYSPQIDTSSGETRGKKTPSSQGQSHTGPFSGGKPLPVQTFSVHTSAFFGSPACHLFRTKSPYRRALQGAMTAETDVSQPKSPEFNPWTHSLTNIPLRCPNTCESDLDSKMQYAKSIYSCVTEEPKNKSSYTIDINGDSPRPLSTHGEATIFIEPPIYRPNRSAPPVPPKERVTSSASLLEWKTWLSANMSKLEGSPGQSEGNDVQYSLPSTSSSSRHVRESAQIVDENGNESEHLDVYQPTRAGGILPSTGRNSKTLACLPLPVSKVKNETPSSDKENEAPHSPPIPLKNVLRATSSLTGAKSGSGQHENVTGPSKYTPLNYTPRKSLLHVRSFNALRGSQPRETPDVASRLPQRQIRPLHHVAPISSPGIAAAVDKQFGSLDAAATANKGAAAAVVMKEENVSPRAGANKNPYGAGGTGNFGSESRLNPRESGSKKMIDSFLSSRRRRIASSEDGSVFL